MHGNLKSSLVFILFAEMNKLKKRRFHTMKNLITGQTDAHPDLIRVGDFR